MEFERGSGVLLHPTSFPGPYGIGDLGSAAYRFVDFLAATHQKYWQVLPLAPTGYGDSPYAALSAFAGNPLLISPDILLSQGLLDRDEAENHPPFPADRVDYGPVIEWKFGLLRRSYETFKSHSDQKYQLEMIAFEQKNAAWLEDYALFIAIKNAHGGAVWSDWEPEIALREPAALIEWRSRLSDEIGFQKYMQYLFYRQWDELKRYTNERDIKIIGDIPIFVAYDSADVWANSNLFYLDSQGRALLVAGVPPDYFSATGQYWGNPLYRWDYLALTGYKWWIERIRHSVTLTDLLRIDHFRGFAAYWEVPANDERTAANGRWVPGPGVALFQAIRKELGDLPIIAEDLGIITPDVVKIREEMDFPGMRVIQFAFGAFDSDWTDPYLPHNYEPRTVVYTGTHDNNTTAGWFSEASEPERTHALTYLDLDPNNPPPPAEVAWKMVRLAFSSVAELAVVPLQDLLGLGGEARMNFPGRAENNWAWRYHPDSLSDWLRNRLSSITEMFARYVPPGEHKGQGNI